MSGDIMEIIKYIKKINQNWHLRSVLSIYFQGLLFHHHLHDFILHLVAKLKLFSLLDITCFRLLPVKENFLCRPVFKVSLYSPFTSR